LDFSLYHHVVRVLLVEDDTTIAEFVARGLREAGFAVDHEADGEAGLGLQLPVHQFRGLFVVLDPDQTVALLPVLQPWLVHLTGQPFPSIQPHLHVEREPSLDPRIHPSHLRMGSGMGKAPGRVSAGEPSECLYVRTRGWVPHC